MTTINKPRADILIKLNGQYKDDPRVIRIIRYKNQWDGIGYGLEYAGQEGKYSASPSVRNPSVYWEFSPSNK